jgi:tRNA threonylcarbamoyladenosine biosynthesis protein TsaB
MTILCIETSTTCCSAAICIDGNAVATRENLSGANHASELPVFIEQLLAEAEVNQWTIDAVALSQGPGSYTGLRIGASLAKGLCYGLDVPLIPVDTLQVLCAAVKAELGADALLCPMLDARRMEVYAAVFKNVSDQTDAASGNSINSMKQIVDTAPVIVDETSFAEYLAEGPCLFIGDGAGKCADVLTHPNAHFCQCHPKASSMLFPALDALRAGDFKDVAYFEPFYLKEFVATVSKKKLF